MRTILGWVGVGMVLGLLAGCDFEDFPIDDTLDPGPVCYTDADCVPSGCCGEGMDAVHVSEAPDCSGIQCSGACPTTRAQCGCAIPICRNSRCDIAVTDCG